MSSQQDPGDYVWMGGYPFVLYVAGPEDFEEVARLVREAAGWLGGLDTDQWQKPWPDQAGHEERIRNDLRERKRQLTVERIAETGLKLFIEHGYEATTLDAIAMGLPVVTWAGRTIISRLAASCLAALDLPQFIALDLADYIAIAAHAVGDLDALATLRGGLRDRLMHSAVGDPVRYARAVEAAYRVHERGAQGRQHVCQHERVPGVPGFLGRPAQRLDAGVG